MGSFWQISFKTTRALLFGLVIYSHSIHVWYLYIFTYIYSQNYPKRRELYHTWILWVLWNQEWRCFFVEMIFPFLLRWVSRFRRGETSQRQASSSSNLFAMSGVLLICAALLAYCWRSRPGKNHSFFVWCMLKPFLYHPSDWYIYLLIYHKSQPHVGKYTSPMDGMGPVPKTNPQKIEKKNPRKLCGYWLRGEIVNQSFRWFLVGHCLKNPTNIGEVRRSNPNILTTIYGVFEKFGVAMGPHRKWRWIHEHIQSNEGRCISSVYPLPRNSHKERFIGIPY